MFHVFAASSFFFSGVYHHGRVLLRGRSIEDSHSRASAGDIRH